MKAADDTLHAYRAYQREAEVVPQLPSAMKVPAFITTAEGGRWFAVVSEWVEGRMPGVPWTDDEFAVVTAACERIAAAMEPSPSHPADVLPEHLECFVGAIAAYMMLNTDAPPPRGCTPALRAHQKFYAWTFLDWLAARRGW